MCVCVCAVGSAMAGRGGPVQRPNGIPREKICQFKLVLLGKEWFAY